jgi:hypothetical protein
VNRFIDDVSVLAIEDCLISKLPTLFRSSNVLDMSDEDIARLAGETRESSLERKRLEAKRGILEKGLQSLKSLHKRRNTVHPAKQDHESSQELEEMSATTPSNPETASIAPDSAEAAPSASVPDEPSHYPDRVVTPVDEWTTQAGLQGDMDAVWGLRVAKRDKKKGQGMIERPPVGW